MLRAGVIAIVLLLLPIPARAQEVMPPPPGAYFNDYARVCSPGTVGRLDQRLRDLDRTNTTQVVVAVFPRMQSPSSVEDYVHRMFEAWKIGQKGRNNGVLLAVFVQDRRLRIEVGYGLEAVLPDALGRRIIDNEITPAFKRGDFDAGLAAGVQALVAAVQGEYRAAAATPPRRSPAAEDPLSWFLRTLVFNRFFPWNVLLAFIALRIFWALTIGRLVRRGVFYDGRGRRYYNSGSGWGGWGGGGGWSGGGGGGGGFSGGGGSSGGGGASGSW
jgi:uncharacterized protein